jgi:hypothetical protein
MNRYIIIISSARMPANCLGIYRRIGLLEVTPEAYEQDRSGVRRLRIDTRAKGVVRIVATWERLNVGKTDKCAFIRALTEAQALLATLENARAAA